MLVYKENESDTHTVTEIQMIMLTEELDLGVYNLIQPHTREDIVVPDQQNVKIH